MPYQLAWFIFLLPVAAFAVICLLLRPFFSHKPHWSAYATIAAIGASLVLSVWTLITVIQAPDHQLHVAPLNWVVINDFTIQVGLLVDSLTAIMLVMVTSVSLLVQIYSQGYMHGDSGYPRYFAWMALFTANMLGLVMADNLVFMYVFWEGVGLCSYLLIGFWFHRPSAAAAAKKAFLVTRLGDFGFLAGILSLYFTGHTFNIESLREMAMAGALAGSALTWAAVGIFAGAAGKSAQFPLHTWLPDAMEGPTPVSSLIHAATMVAAGVFLVARTFPLFVNSEQALTVVTGIGAFTAIFAASMGLVANDIKRVMAYSTVSQLGYMMLALGAGGLAFYSSGSHITAEEAAALGVSVGIFHLFNHAFFKCLLFLGSGSVNHATGTFDMRYMGGLRKYMPVTTVTFVIASLSLAGIWPLSGFWSKDEILSISWQYAPVWFYLALITVFMTAFYVFRAVFLTFGGEYRGGDPDQHHSAHGGSQGGHHAKPHESPRVMLVPMIVLAVLSIGSGWVNATGALSSFLGDTGATKGWLEGLFGIFAHPLPWISLVVAGSGVFLAHAMYNRKWISAQSVGKAFKPIYTMLSRKYWMDELYEGIIVRSALLNGLFRGSQELDQVVVDRAANGIGNGAITLSKGVRRLQTGQLQGYGVAISVGVVAILLAFYFWH
ncbi:MAG TPA: NADH-quinone oxidoreductase subunit L [Dehalococcoidia bacterium]|nr:NADH-quinone oxidoreductase subunit L [Dehalococcoidia bacterium]